MRDGGGDGKWRKGERGEAEDVKGKGTAIELREGIRRGEEDKGGKWREG